MKKKIKSITNTKIKYEIDYIISLVIDKVCGLNIPLNLQIITEEENRKKENIVDLNNITMMAKEMAQGLKLKTNRGQYLP